MSDRPWATSTTRSDTSPRYKYTELLPRVINKGTSRKFGKTWELTAAKQAMKWKAAMSIVEWPSEQMKHNGRIVEVQSTASVASLTPSLYVEHGPLSNFEKEPLIPPHKSTLKIPTLSFHDFERFAEELKTNFSVHTLDVSNNALGNQGAKYFANALGHNQHLEHLVLWGNNISDAGAKAIAEALKHNCTLKSLQIGHNRISSEGAIAIIEALRENYCLEGLFMEGNLLDDACEGFFHDMLKVNKSLIRLNLRHNKLGPEAGKDIAEGLKRNKTLEAIYLENNHLGDEGSFAIHDALEENTTLKSCHTNKNRMTKEGHRKMEHLKLQKQIEETKAQEEFYNRMLKNLETHK